MANLISDTLDILFKLLSEREKQKKCWPHKIVRVDGETFCMNCKKVFGVKK